MRDAVDSYVFPGAFRPILSLDALIVADADGVAAFDLRSDDPEPDALVERSEAFSAIESFVGSLSDRDQMIIRRLFWKNQTRTEIAVSLGVSKTAIGKAVARILNSGREVLAGYKYSALTH
jgi:DNA-directed RNA polymerase specialized sigma subunit